ncbi:MAG: multidrug efflux SMR transporter [Lysobacterales bacterium]
MAWTWLFLAAGFEICWALAMKSSIGFTRFWPTLTFVVCAAASLGCLGLAARQLPIGLAYAVWTGIGACGVTLIAAYLHGEGLSPLQLGCIGMILIGVIGLKLGS